MSSQLTLDGRPDRGARQVTVFVPGIPPTPNDRAHWQETYRVRKAWRQHAVDAAGATGSGLIGSRVDVELVFVYGVDRRRDPDNQVASAKPLLDGLVDAGLLPDDSNRVIRRLGVETEVRRSSIEGVRVTLTEVLDD